MFANCGVNTHRLLVWNGYELPIAMPTELCTTYPEMQVSSSPPQVNHYVETLMLCLETMCMVLFNDAHHHPIYFSDCSKCLILFTNIHFSIIIQRSCLTVTNWSSCWCVVLVCATQQCCLCVATKTFRELCTASGFQYFLVIPLSPASMSKMCAMQTRKKWIFVTSKMPTAKPHLKFMQKKWRSVGQPISWPENLKIYLYNLQILSSFWPINFLHLQLQNNSALGVAVNPEACSCSLCFQIIGCLTLGMTYWISALINTVESNLRTS